MARKKKSVPAWHAPFLAMMPRIAQYARVTFRRLNPEAREEAVAECVANACKAYARLVERGKADVARAVQLARYAIRQFRDGRRVGTPLNINDVSSPYCQRRKCLNIGRLVKRDPDAAVWREFLIEDRHAGPAEVAASRIDFAAWLRSLPLRLRRIAKFLANGETTTAAAEKFGVSKGRISQIRTELKLAWQRFVGDGPELAAA